MPDVRVPILVNGIIDATHLPAYLSQSNIAEIAQDSVAAMLAQGAGVTLTYNDTANTLTVAATGGGGSLDAEAVRDAIGIAMVGVGNISVVVNDAADTITISTTATANSTDAQLRDRSTHTGTQSADTITDGASNVAMTGSERLKLTGLSTNPSVASTQISDSGAAGREVVKAATANAVRDYLDVAPGDINTQIASYLAANPLIIAVGNSDPDPAVVNGRLLVRLAGSTAAKTAAPAGEYVTPDGVVTSATFAPSTTSADQVVVALIIGGQFGTSTGAGRNAGYPATVTGGGRTWTILTDTQQRSSNNQLSSCLAVGVSNGGPLTNNIVVTMGAAETGTAPSTSHDRILVKLTACSGVTAVVGTPAKMTSTLTSTPHTINGVPTTALVLAMLVQNAQTNTALPVTSDEAVWPPVNPQVTAATPTSRAAVAYNLSDSANRTVTWTTSSTAIKLLTLVALN